ncbi:MAG TPA: hypothetical protein VIL33_04300, partial [Rhodothermia bacterium]
SFLIERSDSKSVPILVDSGFSVTGKNASMSRIIKMVPLVSVFSEANVVITWIDVSRSTVVILVRKLAIVSGQFGGV